MYVTHLTNALAHQTLYTQHLQNQFAVAFDVYLAIKCQIQTTLCQLWTPMVLLGGLAMPALHAPLRYCHWVIYSSFSHIYRCLLSPLYPPLDCTAWMAIFLWSGSMALGPLTPGFLKVIISFPMSMSSALEVMHTRNLRRTLLPKPPPAHLIGLLPRVPKKTRFMSSNKQVFLC